MHKALYWSISLSDNIFEFENIILEGFNKLQDVQSFHESNTNFTDQFRVKQSFKCHHEYDKITNSANICGCQWMTKFQEFHNKIGCINNQT